MKSAKLKPKKCRVCRTEFLPSRPLQRACGLTCALELGKEGVRRKLAREKREGRVRLRSRRDWARLAQAQFNKFVRLRDRNKPCICCGWLPTKEHAIKGHSMDAGHYRSVGAAPQLRFNEDNCHAQAVQCNRHKSGNAIEYRQRLIDRIGPERVEALESNNEIRRFSIDELKGIVVEYKSKCKELLMLSA